MLDTVFDLPDGAIGLRANGTVISQDISQALVRARAEPGVDKSFGLILFIDPDLDGYLSEIVSALITASEEQPPQFRRWALVVADDTVSEVEQYRGGGKLKIFPESRRNDALAWLTT